MIKYPLVIPQFNLESNTWTEREFLTQRDFLSFVEGKWKIPGQYNLKRTDLWRQPAIKFQTDKIYCDFHEQSEDYKDWWKTEKKKTKTGVIFNIGTDEFYVTGDYYWFLNFTPIVDKVKGRDDHAEVWDGHYHYSLYDLLCELYYLNDVNIKARQKGISIYKTSQLTKGLWFEKNFVGKMLGYEEDFVSEKGSWKFIVGYRNHLNEHTPWYRNFEPDETMNWEQKQSVTEGDVYTRKTFKGLRSKLISATTKKNPAKAVGGACHPEGTKVWTIDGLKDVKNIKVGDLVIGKDGLPKKVLNLTNGYGNIYHIEQSLGKDFYCSEEHLLVCFNRHSKKARYLTPVDCLKGTRKDVSLFKNYRQIKSNSVFYFNSKDLKIDPYLLGLWLGDGYSKNSTIIVNKTKDEEILEYLESISEYDIYIKRKESDRYKDEMYLVSLKGKSWRSSESFFSQLKHYDLVKNKHIPKEYLLNNETNRLKLLAGIIDTDGTYDPKRRVYNITSSKLTLIEDIYNLCTSLGIRSSYRKVFHKGHYTGEQYIKETESYILRIEQNLQLIIPTKVKRKQQDVKTSNPRNKQNSKFKVRFDRKDYYYGFECEDHLYVLEDGTITHNCSRLWCEESGIAPNLDKVLEYADAATKMGGVKTGQISVGGAVGELKDCKPLEEIAFNPEAHGFLGVEDVFSENPQGKIGFFFPDFWNYITQDPDKGIIKCYDEDGNSNIELAKEYLKKEEAEQRKKGEEKFRLWKSQHPWNLQDAFAMREENPFPVDLIKEHQTLLVQTYKPLTVEIKKEEGKLKTHFIEGFPVRTLKVDPHKDNRGCIEIFELPVSNPPWGLYYAGIDPIAAKNTSTSKSLQSVTVYKAIHYVGDKLVMDYPVAQYTGRHPKWEDTYRTSLDLMHLYNTRTCVENNISDFIEWCIKQGESKYLMRRKEVTMLNEMVPNSTIRDEIGVRMEGEFKKKALRFLETYVDEIIGTEFEEDGTSHYIYGVTRIKDVMILEEFLKFNPRLNTDRIISFSLALLAARSNTNRNIIVETRSQDYTPRPKQKLIIPSQFQQRPHSQKLIFPSNNQFKRK
jgi:hypothetical protein